MIRSDFYRHIEYLYPDIHTRTLITRLSFLGIAFGIIAGVMIYLFYMIFTGEESFLMFAMGFFPIASIFFFWLLMDNIKFFRTPTLCFNAMAKVVLTQEGVSVAVYSNIFRKLKWIDIDIIEKSYDKEGRKLTFICNPYNDRIVVCDDKKKNYIQIPSRGTIEEAVRRFSKREITLADPNNSRFTINNR